MILWPKRHRVTLEKADISNFRQTRLSTIILSSLVSIHAVWLLLQVMKRNDDLPFLNVPDLLHHL